MPVEQTCRRVLFREERMRLIYADLDLEHKARVLTVKEAWRNRQRILRISPASETQNTKKEKNKYPEEMCGQMVDIII